MEKKSWFWLQLRRVGIVDLKSFLDDIVWNVARRIDHPCLPVDDNLITTYDLRHFACFRYPDVNGFRLLSNSLFSRRFVAFHESPGNCNNINLKKSELDLVVWDRGFWVHWFRGFGGGSNGTKETGKLQRWSTQVEKESRFFHCNYGSGRKGGIPLSSLGLG